MLIYLDVKYTADTQDKIELYKNTKTLTSNECTGYAIDRTFKNALLLSQLFLIISALMTLLDNYFLLKWV